jgi:hypothetical protein
MGLVVFFVIIIVIIIVLFYGAAAAFALKMYKALDVYIKKNK